MAGETGKAAAGQPLTELMRKVEILNTVKLQGVKITDVTADSRLVGPGSLFAAVPGLTVDGHEYVAAAVKKGCAAVLVEKGRCADKKQLGNTLCLEVADTRKALGETAAAFWKYPARKMTVIGITGTNGKTTTTYLLESVIRQHGGKPGVIGTVNYRYDGKEFAAPFTTPDAVSLQRLLRQMADASVTHVIMEVSSHALEQQRLVGLAFDIALFTNLSRDHLDFHGDMENYFASKKKLFFEYLKPGGKAVVVCSREAGPAQVGDWGRRLAREIADKKGWSGKGKNKRELITCGLADCDVSVMSATESLGGTTAQIDCRGQRFDLQSGLVGDFNLQNLLGAAGVAAALALAPNEIASGLAVALPAPGRVQKVAAPRGVNVFVDYAHTPDALENVLQTLRKLARGRLIVVFGCGGDRDRGKRPLMGKAAAAMADITVLTSDNPRSEDPRAILADIEQGVLETGLPRMRVEVLLKRSDLKGYDVIVSRREAIRTAIRHARPGDVVAICGKGHETYQITKEGKTFFDDCVEAAGQAAVLCW